jgi:zinc D-Ala-D-Ala carboxypeptidase
MKEETKKQKAKGYDTKNFKRHSKYDTIACPCEKCGGVGVGLSKTLLIVLEHLRKDLGKPVTVTSGYRCTAHNAAVGGAAGSKHLLGLAADIKVKGMSPTKVAKYLAASPYANFLGVGTYSSWVHVDVARTRFTRWRG